MQTLHKATAREIQYLFDFASRNQIPQVKIKEIASNYGYRKREYILAKDYYQILNKLKQSCQYITLQQLHYVKQTAHRLRRGFLGVKTEQEAEENGLLHSTVSQIVKEMGYQKAKDIPQYKAGYFIQKIEATLAWKLWISLYHAQSWAICWYEQVAKIDYSMDKCDTDYEALEYVPGQCRYETWFQFVMQNTAIFLNR